MCSPSHLAKGLMAMSQAMANGGIPPTAAKAVAGPIPSGASVRVLKGFYEGLEVPLDERGAAAILKLVDALEDHDDVQKVHANFAVTDDILARLAH